MSGVVGRGSRVVRRKSWNIERESGGCPSGQRGCQTSSGIIESERPGCGPKGGAPGLDTCRTLRGAPWRAVPQSNTLPAKDAPSCWKIALPCRFLVGILSGFRWTRPVPSGGKVPVRMRVRERRRYGRSRGQERLGEGAVANLGPGNTRCAMCGDVTIGNTGRATCEDIAGSTTDRTGVVRIIVRPPPPNIHRTLWYERTRASGDGRLRRSWRPRLSRSARGGVPQVRPLAVASRLAPGPPNRPRGGESASRHPALARRGRSGPLRYGPPRRPAS